MPSPVTLDLGLWKLAEDVGGRTSDDIKETFVVTVEASLVVAESIDVDPEATA